MNTKENETESKLVSNDLLCKVIMNEVRFWGGLFLCLITVDYWIIWPLMIMALYFAIKRNKFYKKHLT